MVDEARSRSPVAPGDTVGGKYRVDRVLGSGGMGVVVAATHMELDQPVALKFILPEALAGKDAIERFTREARAVARLKGEHVARVFDVGRHDGGAPYMVLELLEGQDLAKLNVQKRPLPIADAVEYVLQACEALVEAHAVGIVHRDLKPQNLFVGRRLNGTPLVKVLDFGIAKAFGAAAVGQMALTDSQAVMGSPLYMAPEHMRSARAADVRSDIWSLGVILYELLGGQLPFDGETVTEVCIRVVNEAPPALLSLRPELDPKLAGVVMQCLEKDPAKRWQNVAKLGAALEPFSRSFAAVTGQQDPGVALRPWRSFEDTLDSLPANARASSEDTGPSTAVTMPTGENLAKAEGRAPSPATTPNQPLSLVATDVSWGTGGEPRPAGSRPRSFTKGIAVGVVVSIGVAAALLFGLRPAPQVTTSAAVTSHPSGAASVTDPLSAPPHAVSVPVLAADPSGAVVTPAGLPNASPPPSAKARAVVGPSRVKPVGSPANAPVAPPSVSTAAQAPNGAPILR